jgi:hypothetical protein
VKLSRQLRVGVEVVTASITATAALFTVPTPQAQAFFIEGHEPITRNALPPDLVDESAMLQILVGPPPGGGAVASDAYATDVFRHLDNAKNPADICASAQVACNTFTPVFLSGAQPSGPGGTDLVNGFAARAAFGGLAHVLQDFYSHSNWVEDNVAAGQPERLAPPIFPTCDPAAFPPGLHTGYFSMDFSSDFPYAGCPPGGPPPGFEACHTVLYKDGPTQPQGSVRVPGTDMNYFDLAALLATRATTDLFWQIRGLVVGSAGECVANNLFQADRHEPCAP